MHKTIVKWGTLAGVWMGLLIVTGGCGPSGLTWGGDTEANACCLKAKQAEEERDFDTALELYKKALLLNPQLADAHLEIGLLYEGKKKDQIAAIYHYRKYLELAPYSSKRQMVKDFIERAKVSLLTSLPQAAMLDGDSAARLETDNTNLAQENARLHARVAELEKMLEQRTTQDILQSDNRPAPQPVGPVASVPATPAPVLASNAPAPAPSSTGRTHQVQKGDTLYSLAQRYYGNRADWQKIYEANRQVLASKNQLKVGQQLVIP